MSASVHHSKYDEILSVDSKIDSERKPAYDRATDFIVNHRKRRRVRHDAFDGFVDRACEPRAKSRLLLFIPPLRCAGFFLGLRPKDDRIGHVPSASFRRTSCQEIVDLGLARCSAQRRSSSARCSGPSLSSASRS